MPDQDRKLILITGIPGTGKTTYGESFAKQFGFTHYDLEDNDTLQRFAAAPVAFIQGILQRHGDTVVTWGFVPDEVGIALVNCFKEKGFTLVWFDGNRPAALRAFIKRGDVSLDAHHIQMGRIENSMVIQKIEPLIISTFDENENFKDPAAVLAEIVNAKLDNGPNR